MSSQGELLRLAKLGRKAEARKKVTSGCLRMLLVSVLRVAASGFELMLAVGVIHHEVWPVVPTLGYWWACLLVFLVRGALKVPNWKAATTA